MRVAVVGVPKTIDNDILMMDKTFGFDTAVEEAQRAINSAYIEVKTSYIITSIYGNVDICLCFYMSFLVLIYTSLTGISPQFYDRHTVLIMVLA